MIKWFLGFFNNKSSENIKDEDTKEENSNAEELMSFDLHMSNGMNSLKKTEEYMENNEYKEILSLNMSAIVAFEHALKMTTDPETIEMIQRFIDETKEKNTTMAMAISLEI